jgi:hypothetical protein
MWRTVLSLTLMLGSVAWCVFALVLVFSIVPAGSERFLGRTGAVYGTLVALVGVVWSCGRLMRLADRVLNDPDHHEPLPPKQAAEADTPASWHEYSAQIAQSKRWAFYRRTRQFERLAELEASARRQSGQRGKPASEPPEARVTQREAE